ncbi:MAG: ArsR family transcriptional regulator [Actinobacteria bacterium]|nr:ArsR family transcriptional regulator [Actinomycetota bacterium]
MKKATKVFKALSDPARLRVLKMLESRPLCVCEIQHVLNGSQPNVSHHLKALHEAGLLESWKDGLWVNYNLPQKPESPLHAAVLSLVRKSLASDETVKKDRKTVANVNRLVITCRR